MWRFDVLAEFVDKGKMLKKLFCGFFSFEIINMKTAKNSLPLSPTLLVLSDFLVFFLGRSRVFFL